MANEGVIKVQYPTAGLGTITVKILKPDDTVRVASVALTDAGHANLYSNVGAVTIEAGDTMLAYDGVVNIGGNIYQLETFDTIANKLVHGWNGT